MDIRETIIKLDKITNPLITVCEKLDKDEPKFLPYLKTIMNRIKGVNPNDIYFDGNQANIYVIPGSNITVIQEQVVKRLKNTWLKDYIEKLQYRFGTIEIHFKEKEKVDEGFLPPSYDILGSIIEEKDGTYNIINTDGQKMLNKNYPSLKKLLLDLAANL